MGSDPDVVAMSALRRVDELLKSGRVHVVDVDIKGYFDSIPHQRLMELVGERIADGRVLALIERMLKAGGMDVPVVRASRHWLKDCDRICKASTASCQLQSS